MSVKNSLDADIVNFEADRSLPPRLQLAYVFLWLTLLSVSMGIWITLLSVHGVDWAEGIGWWSICFYATNSVVLGTGLTGIALLASWKWQGIRYEWQPGDEILVYLGIYEFIRICAVAIDLAISDSGITRDETTQDIYRYMALTQHGLGLCLFLMWMIRPKTTLLWRFGFVALVLQNLFVLFEVIFRGLIPEVILGPIPTSLFVHNLTWFYVLLIALVDIVQGSSRGWLHWTGVATLVMFSWHWIYALSL